ncbi:hypothetical protein [Streptomyces sp. NPDC048191]|uniref:hypothetical protein n=1 Tax=Streptomyces sp. NPDC048191 TaxID=3155484 RepID=UPI0033FFD46F
MAGPAGKRPGRVRGVRPTSAERTGAGIPPSTATGAGTPAERHATDASAVTGTPAPDVAGGMASPAAAVDQGGGKGPDGPGRRIHRGLEPSRSAANATIADGPWGGAPPDGTRPLCPQPPGSLPPSSVRHSA